MSKDDHSQINSSRWNHLKEIFALALERPADKRQEFIRTSCAGDAKMEAEVMRLLAEDAAAGVFLSSPMLSDYADAAQEARPYFKPGDLLAERFRIVRFIASGGMGEVYEAEDQALDERVALKTIRPGIEANERALELFKKEIQLARRVTHPNVCRIFDLFQHQDDGNCATHFLSMELLAGRTLAQYLSQEGPLPAQEALPLIGQMAEALQAAHDAGVIHRDFKPGNVMLVPGQSGQARAVITDFGLAISPLREDEGIPGAAGGTPDYMAPEQAAGGPTSAATDVYAFGRVIAEMAGGGERSEGKSSGFLRMDSSRRPAGKPGIHLPPEAACWRTTIERCLAADPSHRLSRPKDVAEALRLAAQGMTRSRRRILRSAVFAVLTVAALLAGIMWLRRGSAIGFKERDWVLISRFENQTGENVLDGLLEIALQAELSNSRYVNVVPPERISDALRLMKKPPDTAIVASVGREICLRDGGIRVLITGRAVRVGPKYLLTAEVKDPIQNLILAGMTQEAADRSQVLTAVHRLGADIRKNLGERLPRTGNSGERLEPVTTSSLRALSLYSRGMSAETLGSGINRWVIAEAALRQAVNEDPSFAMARIMLAWALHNQGKPKQEWQPHAEKAFQLASKASERERYFIQASYYTMARADDKAIPLYETLVSLFPDDYWGINNLANALERTKGPDAALPYIMRKAALRPNGYGENNSVVAAILRQGFDLDRIKPYVHVIQQLPARTDDPIGASYELYPVFEHWIANDPVKARDELARFAQGLEARKTEERNRLLFRMRDWYLTLGMLASAEQIERSLELGNALMPRVDYPWIAYARGDMSEFRRRAQALLTEKPTGMGAITLARAGYIVEAEKWAAIMEGEKRAPLMLMVVQGECALARGRAPEAVRLLQEALGQMRTGGYAQYFLCSMALAQARLDGNDLAKAIETLEEASSLRAFVFYQNGMFWLQIQHRLAQLYRKSGRESAAERIEAELRRLLACADHDLRILNQ